MDVIHLLSALRSRVLREVLPHQRLQVLQKRQILRQAHHADVSTLRKLLGQCLNTSRNFLWCEVKSTYLMVNHTGWQGRGVHHFALKVAKLQSVGDAVLPDVVQPWYVSVVLRPSKRRRYVAARKHH
eukprot:scaffold1476_cov264-Pinguiococcus_pyrenoidosus.AAC.6